LAGVEDPADELFDHASCFAITSRLRCLIGIGDDLDTLFVEGGH
jgi:hypothetical protein